MTQANRPLEDVDHATIAALQRGDMAAFEAVYRHYADRAWTLALRLTARPDAASDVVQDAMLKGFEHAKQFRFEAPFWAWLRRLVVNEALLRLRREHLRIAEPFDDDHVDDRAPPPWLRADAATLERALAKLPDATRAVLWLYHVEGYTHVEIARQFGRSTSFSKSQLARGTRRLRQLLAPTEAPPCMTGTTTLA